VNVQETLKEIREEVAALPFDHDAKSVQAIGLTSSEDILGVLKKIAEVGIKLQSDSKIIEFIESLDAASRRGSCKTHRALMYFAYRGAQEMIRETVHETLKDMFVPVQ